LLQEEQKIYSKQFEKVKHIRLHRLIAGILLLLLIPVVGIVESYKLPRFIILFWTAIFLSYMIFAGFVRCPKCGKFFFFKYDGLYLKNNWWFIDNCRHCGFPKDI